MQAPEMGKPAAAGAARGSQGKSRAANPTSARNNRSLQPARRTLPEPIIISEWWRDRSGRSIRVSLNTYEGHNLIDVRTWWTGDDGKLKPGKGFACSVRHLSRLAAAIAEAIEKAGQLGLIKDGTP
jgi:hypothetical protein